MHVLDWCCFRFLHSNQISRLPKGVFAHTPHLRRLWVIRLGLSCQFDTNVVCGGGYVDFVGYIRSCCHFWTHLLNYIPVHTHSSVSVGRMLDCKVWRNTNAGLILWCDEGFFPESTFNADSCTVIAQPPCCALHQHLQVHWKLQTQAAFIYIYCLDSSKYCMHW